MSAVNWYFRSDTWTVNGLTAYKLDTTAGTGFTNFSSISTAAQPCYGGIQPTVWLTVDIRHYNGSLTNIAAQAAYVTSPYYSDGLWYSFSTTWACPYTPLVSSDALQITVTQNNTRSQSSEVWITDVLRAAALKATTWTVNYRVNSYNANAVGAPYVCYMTVYSYVGFGDTDESITGPDVLLRGPLPTFFQAV